MIDAYLTDIIQKVSVTMDEYGVSTETTSSNIDARVEDYNKLIIDDSGQEVMSELFITAKTSEIFLFGDKIIIKEKAGETYEQPNKKFIIKKKIKVAGFSSTHWELYL